MRPRLPSWIRSRSGRPGRLVLLRDRHDQPQVRLHERLLGVLAVARGPAQPSLLGRSQPVAFLAGVSLSVAVLDLFARAGLSSSLWSNGQCPDVGEVETDQVFFRRSPTRSFATDQLLPDRIRQLNMDLRPAPPGVPRSVSCTITASSRGLWDHSAVRETVGALAIKGGEGVPDDVEIAMLTATFDARPGAEGAGLRPWPETSPLATSPPVAMSTSWRRSRTVAGSRLTGKGLGRRRTGALTHSLLTDTWPGGGFAPLAM